MSAKIYWGRPGSYKTSSAVKTDLPEFAFAGRVVVTNVRGLDNAERVRTVLEKKFKKKVPDSFEIINVESETSEGREKWARFFHWAPLGCAFIIDEVQDVWKKKWTATYINTLNYPGGADAAQADGRPFDFAISFEQHRHYNWDFVCTTPHIKRIRDDVREISDMAYKHINMALMGISGKYKQFGHDPDNNCRNDKDADTGRIGLVIPKWVFELYESTVTGDISDTRSGFKFWKEPKILILFGVGVLAWGYAIYNFPALKARFSGESKEPEMSQESNTVQGGQSSPPVPASKNKYFTDLSNLNVFYAGKVKVKGVINYLFNVEAPTEKQGSIVDGTFFQSLGYAIIEINKNMVMVGNDREQFYIKTKGVTNDKKMF